MDRIGAALAFLAAWQREREQHRRLYELGTVAAWRHWLRADTVLRIEERRCAAFATC